MREPCFTWLNLRDTASLFDWAPYLQMYDLDLDCVAQACLASQHGPAMRAEVNRIVFHLIKNGAGIAHPSSWFTGLLKKARENIMDEPPRHELRHAAWTWYTSLAGRPGNLEMYGARQIYPD